MTDEEKMPELLSIGEVSRRTDLPVSTIRFYENEFRNYLHAAKTAGGHRRFPATDLEKLKHIHGLVHDRGKTLREVKSALVSERDPGVLRADMDLLLEVFETLVQENRRLSRALQEMNQRLLVLEEGSAKRRFKIF